MSNNANLSLQAGERVYINGAVLRADRKVSIELLNDAVYLLESQILQSKDATTPLKQLYFIVQTMLMDQSNSEATRQAFEVAITSLLLAFANERVLVGLLSVRELVAKGATFEALKTIRALFPVEEGILEQDSAEENRLLEAV